MLASFSKIADRNFVIGFFLPALLLVLAAAYTFPELAWLGDVRAVKSDKALTDLIYLVLGVWLVAILLIALVYFEYRILEGYLPPLSWMTWLKRRNQQEFDGLTAEKARMYREWGEQREQYPVSEQQRLDSIGVKLIASFPPSRHDIMPTRFGNAIRAFEFYPKVVYGADSISLWPRLVSVVSKDFQGAVSDARAPVDFFVNTCVLALLFGLCALGKLVFLLVWAAHSAAADAVPSLAVAAAIAFVVAGVAYWWAILNVANWGDLVKSAFDCYLPALGKQLGYVLPDTHEERRTFWTAFSRLATYEIPLTPGKWKFVADKGGTQSSGKSGHTANGGNGNGGDDGGDGNGGDGATTEGAETEPAATTETK
jgi:hypothetical protein